MRIRYRATKHVVEVSEMTGQKLVEARIADEVQERKPKQARSEDKPRRQYRRRDMQAERSYGTRAETSDSDSDDE